MCAKAWCLYCSSLSWKTKLARCLIPLRLVCDGMDNESIRIACAKPKGRPPTMRFMQQAATRWLLPLPNLPDGGLITGAACNPKPWVSPAAVDTMRDAKLFSIYWTAAPVCARSICLSHSLILFRSLPRRWPRHSVPLCCCVLLSDISDVWWDQRCHNSAKKREKEKCMNLFYFERLRGRFALLSVAGYSPERSSCGR